MRMLLVSSLFAGCLLAGPAAAQAPCPISGIQTTPFWGTAIQPFGNPIFELGWDATQCALTVRVEPDPCCFVGNQFFLGHYLIYGDVQLVPPFELPSPFSGQPLLVVPTDVLGPFPGPTSSILVPPDPMLVGRTFLFQGIAEFITTLSIPVLHDYVLSHGISGTLL